MKAGEKLWADTRVRSRTRRRGWRRRGRGIIFHLKISRTAPSIMERRGRRVVQVLLIFRLRVVKRRSVRSVIHRWRGVCVVARGSPWSRRRGFSLRRRRRRRRHRENWHRPRKEEVSMERRRAEWPTRGMKSRTERVREELWRRTMVVCKLLRIHKLGEVHETLKEGIVHGKAGAEGP
jgi:hypothetical protein